jgi:hypothetical protein
MRREIQLVHLQLSLQGDRSPTVAGVLCREKAIAITVLFTVVGAAVVVAAVAIVAGSRSNNAIPADIVHTVIGAFIPVDGVPVVTVLCSLSVRITGIVVQDAVATGLIGPTVPATAVAVVLIAIVTDLTGLRDAIATALEQAVPAAAVVVVDCRTYVQRT